MKRNLKRLQQNNYDILIIGGGISGACIAWESQSRGLKTALIDKDDFASHTSSATSKLIHGGLRYLKNFELSLVRESLKERSILNYIAPHLVEKIPFHLITPSLFDKILLFFGLKLYDMLAFDRNKLNRPDEFIPSSHSMSQSQSAKMDPLLGPNHGGLYYYDAHTRSPERLVLEFILSAYEKGADVANHVKALSFIKEGNTIKGIHAIDCMDNEPLQIKAKIVINAGGPWADELIVKASQKKGAPLVRSKGIHIITKKLNDNDHVLAMATKKDGHFFIIPWRNHSLIGTTDTDFKGSPDEFKVTEQDVDGLIKIVNTHLPKANINRENVLNFYGGMRPMAAIEGGKSTYNLSRAHEIVDHENTHNIKGLISVIGGKYTTSRALAEATVDSLFKKLSLPFSPTQTHFMALAGGEMSSLKTFSKRLTEIYTDIENSTLMSLAQTYGSRVHQLMSFAKNDFKLLNTIDADKEHILAQLHFAVKVEMACTLEDIFIRRTHIGIINKPTSKQIDLASSILKEHLNLSDDTLATQVENLMQKYHF